MTRTASPSGVISTLLRRLADRLRRACFDDRANIGILLLFIVFSLVALIAMLFNTGEYITRRQHVQNAADTAAHSSATWVARAENAVTGANLVLCENGSAETIWTSISPTSSAIATRLNNEEQEATRLIQGRTAGTPEANIPDLEFFEELLALNAFASSSRGATLSAQLATLETDIPNGLTLIQPYYSAAWNANFRAQMNESLRRNRLVLTFLTDTWVRGQNIASPPCPAGFTGLQALASPWIAAAKSRLQTILSTIPQERAALASFDNQTAPGLSATNPGELASQRERIYQYEQDVASRVPATVEQQRSQLAGAYQCNITHATPVRRGESSDGPAPILAPLEVASTPASQTVQDTIRAQYPTEAQARFGTTDPSVDIDPINVNCDDSCIWHPGTVVSLPPPSLPNFTVQGRSFSFSHNYRIPGGEYGQIPCAPLIRQFNNRVGRDEQGLRPFMWAIDNIRIALGRQINPVPTPPVIPVPPTAIPDPAAPPLPPGTPAGPQPTDIPVPPAAIPQLPIPGGLSADEQTQLRDLNTRIDAFNRAFTTYQSDLRNLTATLNRMYRLVNSLCLRASDPFADNTWLNNVDVNRVRVLKAMGQTKAFLVMETYELRPIPDWASDGMRSSAHDYVYNEIYSRNIGGMTQRIHNDLYRWAFGLAYSAYYDYYLQLYSRTMPRGQASVRAAIDARAAASNDANAYVNNCNPAALAANLINRASETIASEVANEWVHRPWPYEITPPPTPAPPPQGVQPDDRKGYFTLLAGAVTTSANTPRGTLRGLFNGPANPMVAYAQAETFNWMEFNDPYGAADHYDQVTNFGHGNVGGCPTPWRLSTHGGWSWQPRLARADSLYEALQTNPELGQYLQRAGITDIDAQSLDTVNLH